MAERVVIRKRRMGWTWHCDACMLSSSFWRTWRGALVAAGAHTTTLVHISGGHRA